MLDAPRVAGEETRRAIFAQPEWLRAVPTDRRLPEGRVLHTGCGTSFHAAQTAGWAEQALELVLRPRDADALVVVSHEGGTAVSLEAVRAFEGPVWLVTGKPARRGGARDRRRDSRDREELVPHRELHVRRRGDAGSARRRRERAPERGGGGAGGA